MTATEMPATAPAVPSRNWMRLDGVDGLRGLAIFFVLMNHVNMRLQLAHVPYTSGLPEQLTSTLVWNGQNGVQIFFAVSGFLITSTSLRRWGSLGGIDLRDFYLLRVARIAPLLLLLLAILCSLHAAGFSDFVVTAKTGGLSRAVLAALTIHINVLEAQRGYLPGSWDILWSLSVEEMFYLFFPLICRALGRGKLLIAVLLVFAVLGPFARTVFAHGNEVWQEYSYLGGMDAIALGCLTAVALPRLRVARSVLWMSGALGAALLIGRSGLDMTLLALGTCFLIAAAAQSRWRSPRIGVPLEALGRRSYEIYLTHMFVVFALFRLFVSSGKPMSGVPILFVAVILIAAFLGECVARVFSDPLNRRLRRRLSHGRNGLGSATQSV
jgi:peptidoglycan/LPS O-acetylase OafA/YrhL